MADGVAVFMHTFRSCHSELEQRGGEESRVVMRSFAALRMTLPEGPYCWAVRLVLTLSVGSKLDFYTLAPSSKGRTLCAVESLYAFGHRLGSFLFDVGRPLRVSPRKETLAERILSEADTQRLIALEPDKRNRTLLRLLYASGGRVSELCGLAWKDCQERGDAGQVTLFGKGGKTRTILLSLATWQELISLRGNASPEEPVFWSYKTHSHLDRTQVFRIVQAAAKRAGITGKVSPHWLRHAHASHALDRGAPIHLVQATLGHSSVATTGKYLHARPTESSSKYLAV